MAKDHRRLDVELAQEVLLDDPGFLRRLVERVVQQMLEAEMTEHVGAAPHERTDARKGHRNGYKPRTLRTRVGTLNLLVPQDREGTFSTRLFSRYQRNEKALCLALMEMYVEGVSTRKVKDITEELCGTSFSKSLVSELAGSLDAELRVWRNRRLEGMAYPYLFVDARYEKARVGHGVVSQGASWQRCQVHYARNLLGTVGAKRRKELAADLRGIFAAPDRRCALDLASSVAQKWRAKGHEKVACHLEEHIEECLSCLAFPESHRRRIRTTNGLERLNQEIKRRTRVVRIFPNREACLRLVTAFWRSSNRRSG
jgi:putative transposase